MPWSAVKLLRLFRSGDLGVLRTEWRGWTLNRNGIVSPSGDAYSLGDLGWWSLTCRQAEAFRQSRGAQRRATGRSVPEATLASVSELVSATHSYWRDPHTVREVLRVTRTPFFRGYANGLKAIFGGTLHRRLNAHGC
ncbi:MAG: hypothetical protein KGI62_12890 [Xanthomonadaceae bacterium]|nr:hypothetical protein [Xanthomonadaceae bacterium]